MSTTNNNLQTQTSNALHNAIMEAGGKDRLPISDTRTEGYMETYKNVSQDIRDQLNAEAEVVQIILTGIDNDIYSTVDACPNACKMWKAIERLKQGELINVQDLETNLYWEFGKFTSRDEWQRFVTLVKQSQELKTVSYHKLYNILKQHQHEVDEIRTERLAHTTNPLALVLQKRSKDPAYHKEKMLVCKQEEAGIQLSAEQVDWRDDTDNEPDDQELEALYLYVAQIQEVTSDAADHSGPIYDAKPLQKVQHDDDNYNVFSNEREHHDQPEPVNDTYPDEYDIIIDSLDMSHDREQDNQDDNDDLAKERELLASLIEKLKCEIDNSKNRNKLLESSNKILVDNLTSQIEDFKNTNKSAESSNTHFKKANNELSKTNQLMFKDLKKFLYELGKRKPTTFSDSLAKKDFSKSKSVTKNDVSKVFSKPVTTQSLPQNVTSILKNTNVIAPGMYKLHTKPTPTRTPQLPQDIRKTNKRVSVSTGVIPTTSVSRPQLKSNQLEDRIMHNNSQGKKQEVEDHRRYFKFSNNKMTVTACNDSLNAKTLNVNLVCVTCRKCVLNDNHDMCVLHYINDMNSRTKHPIVVPINTREPKRIVNQSVATPLKRTVAVESTNQKPRKTIRKQYEQISKTCKWWHSKITPQGYKWTPKTCKVNVKPDTSMPLGNKSRNTNISESITLRGSTLSNTPLSSNSSAARRDNSIHRRL
ncbi:hypothetical protein Tco_1321484 [Tanacetum coccineum]